MNNIDQITIHQAFYGENQRSHGCLSSTLNDIDLKAFLTGFTDRPSSIPAGIAIEPYYSGVCFNENYIFTYTVPDIKAPRAGMVFTHVLIAKVADLNLIQDLQLFFKNFITDVPKNKAGLLPIHISTQDIRYNKPSLTCPSFVQSVSEGLINIEHPILFCGELSSFVQTVTMIWAGLPLMFRKKVSFTAGFQAINIDRTKTLIYFQENLAYLLKNTEHITDNDSTSVTPISTISKYILNPGGNSDFDFFLNELNVTVNDWTILQSCVKAYESYLHFDNLDVDNKKQLLRQIAKVSPNPNEGISLKDKIQTGILENIRSGKDQNLKSLRNLPLSAFRDGEENFGKAIAQSIEREFKKGNNLNPSQVSGLCALVNEATQKTWWYSTVEQSIIGIFKDINIYDKIWQVIKYSKETVHPVLKFIPIDKVYESGLISNIPNIDSQPIAIEIAKCIKGRGWNLLHAHILLCYTSIKEAILIQIKLEQLQRNKNLEGTSFLFNKISDNDLLALALDTEEPSIGHEFAKRTLTSPSLLGTLDVTNPKWLKLWNASLAITNDLGHGVKKLQNIIDDIFKLVAKNIAIPNRIIEMISKSRFADLSNQKNRNNIWSNLSNTYKSVFLNHTAYSILNKLKNDSLSGHESIEPELSDFISSDIFMSSYLSLHKGDIEEVLTVYENFGNLKDTFLADYINYYKGEITSLQSTRLGSMIYSRQFNSSAKQVFEKAKFNNGYHPALAKCKSLVSPGFIDKMFYGHLLNQSISKDDIFLAIFELSTKLYQHGPEDRNIWERSGGDLSKLHNFRSREENWRYAINLLKDGGGGKNISARSLIKEMLEDYSNNPQLKELLKHLN